MSYQLALAAEYELADVAEYYEAKASARIAQAFLLEFEHTVSIIEQNQTIGRCVESGMRSFSMKRFPYSIIYKPGIDGPVVYAIASHHRRPNYWKNRTDR